jgi:Na+/H+-dicarboxylate symporter
MKLGSKTLLATLAGLIIALVLPVNAVAFHTFLEGGTKIMLQLGRYLVFPLFFFNMTVSIAKLKRNKKLGKTLGLTVLVMVALNSLLTLLGLIVALIVPLTRIPLAFEQEISPSFDLSLTTLLALIPQNAFSLFGSLSFVPLLVLAFVLGLNLAFDHEISEPAYNLFDSLGRVFYRIVGYYVRFSFIPIFFFSANMLYNLRLSSNLGGYFQISLLSLIGVLFIMIIIYGVLYKLLRGERGLSLRYMRGSSTYPLFALFSPDNLLASQNYSYLSHRNQGVGREVGALAIPLLSLFGRAGTAFVSALALIFILKSYNSLGITLLQLVQSFGAITLTTLLLAPVSSGALGSALTLSCQLYGNNISANSAILGPALPMLAPLAATLDAVSLLLVINLLNHFLGSRTEIGRSRFI